MKLIRTILGKVILLADRATTPGSLQRSIDEQKAIDEQTRSLAMYQFHACPFCVKVRRELKRLNLNIELRDAKNDAKHKSTLVEEGGKYQVPCMRIEQNKVVHWMYESDDIIRHLREKFS